MFTWLRKPNKYQFFWVGLGCLQLLGTCLWFNSSNYNMWYDLGLTKLTQSGSFSNICPSKFVGNFCQDQNYLYWSIVDLGFLGGSVVENPPARRCGFNPWDGKIPLEKEMAIHCSILAWEIPWKEEPGEQQSMEFPKSQTHLSM